jgi:hypothetical protein
MRRLRVLGLFLSVLVLAACSDAPNGAFTATRNAHALLDRPDRIDPAHVPLALREQAIQLEDSLHMLTRAPGSAQGCHGLRLSDPAMASCSEAQLKGRTVGASFGGGDENWTVEQLGRASALLDAMQQNAAQLPSTVSDEERAVLMDMLDLCQKRAAAARQQLADTPVATNLQITALEQTLAKLQNTLAQMHTLPQNKG